MTDVLREYLIALGFNVDDESYKKFNAAVATSAKEAAGLGSIVVATATAIGVSVEKIAREYEGLYYASQRTGVSINQLKTFGLAAKQIGLGFDQSASAIESFSAAQRLNPGIKAFVGLSGGAGKDATEQLVNFVDYQKKLYGESGYYVAAINAQLAGIPETTFLQIWKNLPKIRAAQAEMARMRHEAGLDTADLGNRSIEFVNAWDHLLASLSIGRERIASDLMGPVEAGIKDIDQIVQAFNRADVATDGWAGKIAGVTAALGGTTAALALLLRLLGLGGLVGAGAKGMGGILARALAIGGNPVVAGAVATYYGLGLNGETAGKADDEPLSKEYRAKHGGEGNGRRGGGANEQLRATTIKYFEDRGWSRAAATGIAANLSAESGIDPTSVGDNGAAYGVAQWHKDRQNAFLAWSGKDIRGSTLQDQLAFVQFELTQGADPQARRAGEKLKATNDPYNAGLIVSGLYERPYDPHYRQAHARGVVAEDWFKSATGKDLKDATPEERQIVEAAQPKQAPASNDNWRPEAARPEPQRWYDGDAGRLVVKHEHERAAQAARPEPQRWYDGDAGRLVVKHERAAAFDGQAPAAAPQQQPNWYDTPLAPAAPVSNTITVNQTNNNNIVAHDPREAGESLERANNRATGDVVRNFQGMAR